MELFIAFWDVGDWWVVALATKHLFELALHHKDAATGEDQMFSQMSTLTKLTLEEFLKNKLEKYLSSCYTNMQLRQRFVLLTALKITFWPQMFLESETEALFLSIIPLLASSFEEQ